MGFLVSITKLIFDKFTNNLSISKFTDQFSLLKLLDLLILQRLSVLVLSLLIISVSVVGDLKLRMVTSKFMYLLTVVLI